MPRTAFDPGRRRTLGGLAALAAGGLAGPLRAAALAAPTGPVLLTVTGLIDAAAGGAARFDLAGLDALPQRETVTATPWHEGRPAFSGPLLSGLLDAVGATGGTLRLGALNDYAAEMPASDPRDLPVILATRIDGAEIAVRDKGPLFVIYPFDEHPEILNEVYFTRSVWQVATLEVLA